MGQTGLQGGEGAGNLVPSYIHLFNQACLHNETPIKTLDTKAHWSVLVDENTDVLGRVMCPGYKRTEHLCILHSSPSPGLALYVSSFGCS